MDLAIITEWCNDNASGLLQPHDPMPSSRDRDIWDRIFTAVPDDWRSAPPSQAMAACTEWLRQNGVRTVLDVGCGIGRWSIHFARAGMEVAALDFAPHGVAYARHWAAQEGLPIRLACVAATEVAFPGERFDAAVAALVLDNLPREELPVALARMGEAVRPGGLAFFLFNPIAICADNAEDNPTAGITQVRYSDDELRRLLSEWDVDRTARYEAGTRGWFMRRRMEDW